LLQKTINVTCAPKVFEANEAMGFFNINIDGVHVILVKLLVIFDDGVEQLEEVFFIIIARLDEKGKCSLSGQFPFTFGMEK
jgi:hypothetical protein